MSDLLERDAVLAEVAGEVSDIKSANNIGPGQPVKYQPEAVNREGFTD